MTFGQGKKIYSSQIDENRRKFFYYHYEEQWNTCGLTMYVRVRIPISCKWMGARGRALRRGLSRKHKRGVY